MEIYKEIDKEFVSKLFSSPKIIGVVADVNQGKSMLLYNLIKALEGFDKKIVSYGLRCDLGINQIYSVEELESLRDTIILADEFFSLFDLDDRKKVKIIERTLRLINHHNNILILAGVGDNFKKFISNKLDAVFFKKVSLGDFINGSRINQEDHSYTKLKVQYLKEFDTKKDNTAIITEKCSENCAKSVPKSVPKNEDEKIPQVKQIKPFLRFDRKLGGLE
jgi:hypothetical protein